MTATATTTAHCSHATTAIMRITITSTLPLATAKLLTRHQKLLLSSVMVYVNRCLYFMLAIASNKPEIPTPE